MKTNIKKLLSSFAIGGLLVLCALSDAQDGANLKGKALPAFKAMGLDGSSVTNQSLKGKVVVMDFWATWCGPCKAASPTVQKIHNKFASKGVMVIGANVEGMGGAEAKKLAMGYQKEHKYSYKFTYNNEQLFEKLGVSGIPLFLVIDKKGKISYVQTGYGPTLGSELETAINKALKG